MNEVLNQIANLGFPIVLSIYLLIRIEGKLEGLTVSIHQLAKSIETMTITRNR
ncbi:MAG: YvrJ family protein [Clostridiaceae bacterium]|nr:YvrJ family protein [Clostridiaceae bacterium]